MPGVKIGTVLFRLHSQEKCGACNSNICKHICAEYFIKPLKNFIKYPADKVNKPGTDEKVNLSDISRTGGIVNAYEALKLASTLKGERKVAKVVVTSKTKKAKK